MQARIPVSTYRLQFNREFTFAEAGALADYLRELGVTDVYSSPVLRARPGSMHGYDIVDHTQVNPELGGEEQLSELLRRLRELGLGFLVDVVPNHMSIAGGENGWWQDVMENGPSSPFARHFDIDWRSRDPQLDGRIVLPILVLATIAAAALARAGASTIRLTVIEFGLLVLQTLFVLIPALIFGVEPLGDDVPTVATALMALHGINGGVMVAISGTLVERSTALARSGEPVGSGTRSSGADAHAVPKR